MFDMNMNKHFTENAKAAIIHAEVLAHLSRSSLIETSHLLLAIASQEGSVGAKVLREFGLNLDTLREAMGIKPGVVVTTGASTMRFSRALQFVMDMATGLAGEYASAPCGTAHILLCLLSQRQSRAAKLLEAQNIDFTEVTIELTRYIEDEIIANAEREPDEEAADEDEEGEDRRQYAGINEAPSKNKHRQSVLERYTTDLTAAARGGELDPVIGREREIDRLITIISRRTKNNPVLIGDAGVGKTAVVEGLAQRIVDGAVPDFLAERRLLEVDLAAMVAGTKYRGQFEERLKGLIDEAEADEQVILFIDEVHLLVGAGSASGSMDAANLLKPALARGKIHLIGATTSDEYRRHMESDAALVRRLQTVIVDPPNASDTVKILHGLAQRYEEFHHVHIDDQVIDESVRLSDRYLTERQQPDKAIDVLDETAARVRVANASSDVIKELRVCQAESDKLTKQMEQAVAEQDYEHAALYKMRISQLKEKMEQLKSKQTEAGWATVKLNDVAATVSRMTGVPLEQLKKSEMTKLVNLEKNLGRRVIGQQAAVTAVAQAIRRSRAGIADPNRPIGSFIFLGPTGVGKTELTKVLAEEVFGSRNNLIKVDMSEFGERHTVARLVGAPAGYVGYDDGGWLTEKVRRQPYSVILFDEIEKAHPDVFNILLQILEDGVLTDGHGKKADFRNSVVILTSNIGATEMAGDTVGFAVDGETSTEVQDNNKREAVMKALRNTMRPELLNRFDQIVMFNSLGQKEVGSIFDLLTTDLNQRLTNKGIALLITPRLKRHLVEQGYDDKYGARPLRRVIQNELERPIADQIIAGQIKRGDIVRADWKSGAVVLTTKSQSEAVRRRTTTKATKA